MRTMNKTKALLLVLALGCFPGCRTIRGIEQWKCDNWGMCHFGIKPTRPHAKVTASDGTVAEVPDSSDCGCK